MEEKQIKRRFAKAALLVVVAAALLVGGVATYAWFTSNQTVNTSVAQAHTGEEALELQLSSTGGADFRGAAEAAITQVNRTDAEYLMPVSTADLRVFVQASAYNNLGYPSAFAPVQNEANYYHGRIWLRAIGNGVPAGSRMALYLDQRGTSGGILAQKSDGDSLLLNAARLGLVLEGGDSVIFRLSEDRNPAGARMMNTYLGGELQAEGIVINANLAAVADPAVTIDSRAINDDGALGTPLGYLDFERIYVLDVYFYLEGCDPDCVDSISFDGSDLHLAFYGVLA